MNRYTFRKPRPVQSLIFSPPPPRAVELRHICDGDLPDCFYISRCCRGASGADEPITRHGQRGVPTIGTVALLEGRVAGYLLYTAKGSTLVLEDLAVEPFYRRRTVGTHLIRWLRSRLGGTRERIAASVDERAVGLLRFLAVQGFATAKHPTGRYSEGGMVRMIFEAMDTGCERGAE